MIEERARVVSVSGDGEMAEVETQRVTACGTCSSKVGCGSALLAGLFGKRRSRLQALNRIRARPGDGVVIGFPEGLFLRAAFALYAVPLLGMIGGAVTGEGLAAASASAGTELASILGGLLGLVAGLAWVRRFARRAGRRSAFQVVVLRQDTASGVLVRSP